MLLKISNFSGIAPRLSAKLLSDNQAQIARNCKLQSGEIRPFRAPLKIEADLVDDPLTIYNLRGLWLSWAARVSVAPSPVADTAGEGRIYYTGDGIPKKTWYAHAVLAAPSPGAQWKPLSVKAMASAPVLAATTGAIPAGTYAYVVTLVERFGPAGGGVMEESRPSPAALITLASAGGVTVTRGVLPTGSTAEHWCVYRSTSTGSYQLVADNIPVSTTSFTDTLVSPKATVLPSNDWHEPPDDIRGLVSMPNGIMAAFRGNEILFSEPWYPHAWPVKYRQTIPATVVAIAPAGSALVVLTDGAPYIITGTHPETMSQEKIDIASPCVSGNSVVSDGYSVLYAARDGVAAISSAGQHTLVTRNLLDYDDWRELNPESIVAKSYYGSYLAFYEDRSEVPFKIRGLWLQTNDSPPLVQLDIDAIAATGDYFLTSEGEIYRFDAHPINKTRTEWRSKVFSLPRPTNLGAIQVDADFGALSESDEYNEAVAAIRAKNAAALSSGWCGELGGMLAEYSISGSQVESIPDLADERAISVTIYADGTPRATTKFTSTKARKLPSGYVGRDVEISISADVPVYSVTLASSATELRGIS